jgi:hypothetical protein
VVEQYRELALELGSIDELTAAVPVLALLRQFFEVRRWRSCAPSAPRGLLDPTSRCGQPAGRGSGVQV